MKTPWPLSFGRSNVKIPPESGTSSIFQGSCSLAHYQHFLKKSFKSVHKFLSFFANRQTNKQTPAVTHPPPLAEVIIPLTAVLREALYPTTLSLPTWARLQLKTAVTMPYMGQPNVSIFYQ